MRTNVNRPSYEAFGSTGIARPRNPKPRCALAEAAPATINARATAALFLRLRVTDLFRLERELREQRLHLGFVLRLGHRRFLRPQRRDLPLDGIALFDERPHRRIAGVDLQRRTG